MLLCRADRCGYWVEGMCGRPLKSLNLDGACDFLYLPDGRVRQGFNIRQQDIVLPVVSTAAFSVFEGENEKVLKDLTPEINENVDEKVDES